MSDIPTRDDSVCHESAKMCMCGHAYYAHSMFGCLTCAATRPVECHRFVSQETVDKFIKLTKLTNEMRGDK